MTTIPCKNCIVFALCNSKISRYKGVYKTNHIYPKLKCEMLRDWLSHPPTSSSYYFYDPPLEKLKQFCKTFNMKLNIGADTHLTRHLKEYKDKDNNTLAYATRWERIP